MSGDIGYYVHHQGAGHRDRAFAIAEPLPERFVLMGSGLEPKATGLTLMQLAQDRPDDATEFDPYSLATSSLHYAPLNHAGIRNRMAVIANWMEMAKPKLLVCDVSVEIAMLARLMATPVIYVRLNGARHDPAHLEAFRSARMLLAPFHEALDDADTPAWVRQKTCYLPGITGHQHHSLPTENTVLLVNGAGGDIFDGNAVAAAARATPGFNWRSIGPISTPEIIPENLTQLGWVSDPASEIAKATIVIGAAGDGVVSAVIAQARPFICLPQIRPYGEQHAKAQRLKDLAAAVVIESWPTASAWPGLLRSALMLDTANIGRLHDPHGAQKARDFILCNM